MVRLYYKDRSGGSISRNDAAGAKYCPKGEMSGEGGFFFAKIF
jgi:hypothetical protein